MPKEISKNLLRRSVIGSMWVFAAGLFVRVADVLLLVILARYLAPADFGLVALAVSVVVIFEVVANLPTSAPLVRVKAIETSHLDTAMTLALIRAVSIVGAVTLAAPLIASTYGDPRLTTLSIVLSLASGARTLGSPRMVLFVKRISFWQSFLVAAGGKIVAFGAAVAFAAATQSYWALAISPLAACVGQIAISYWIAPYRPRLSLRHWRYFLSFLGWLFPAQALMAASWQIDKLFLGAVLPNGQFGLYGVANTMASAVEMSIRKTVSDSLMPAFVIAQDDAVRLKRGYFMAESATVLIGLPAYILTFAFAEPIVHVIFTTEWAPMAPILQMLSLAIIPSLYRVPFRPLAMAAGRTKLIFLASAIMLVIRVAAVLIGYRLGGLYGVIYAIGIGNVVNAVVTMGFVARLVKVTVAQQCRALLKPLVAAVPVLAVSLVAADVILGLGAPLLQLIVLIGALAFAGVIYGASVFGLWHAIGRPDGVEARVFAKLVKFIRPRA